MRILSQILTLPEARDRAYRTSMGVAGASGALLRTVALVR
jgi:hypothetical protein